MPDRRSSFAPWWLAPAMITTLLLTVNSPWWRLSHGAAFRRTEPAFGLFVEMNFAVWWSAVLYLLSALLFYEIACSERGPVRRGYAQLGLLMLAVVIDEVGSLHEWISGLGGWPALAPFGLVGVWLLIDSLRRLRLDPSSRGVFWMVIAGFALFASVAIQEYAEHNLMSLRFTRYYGRFFEEATELVGAWILVVAAVRRRRGFRLADPLAAVVPDPARMTALLPGIVAGLLLHVVVAQAPLVDVGVWDGVPAAVYPTVVFFLLACYGFWVPRHRPEDSARSLEVRGFWAAAAIFFLLCSIGVMQNLRPLFRWLPGMDRALFDQSALLWVILLAVVWFLGLAVWQRRDARVLWLLGAAPAGLFYLFVHHPSRKELGLGLLACLCALALMRPDHWAAEATPGDSIQSRRGRPASHQEE